MRLLSRGQQKALDQFLVDKGIPLMLLMEAAGTAIADAVEARESVWEEHGTRKSTTPIDLLVGPGMNGGDLYVAARKLASSRQDRKIRIWEPGEPAGGLVGEMREAALAVGIPCKPLKKYKPRGVIVVDGLLGTGFQPERELSEELAGALWRLALAKADHAYIIACDLPSGVVADSGACHELAVAADETVTFFAPKIGQMMSPACQLNGELSVSTLGFPESLLSEFWEAWDAGLADADLAESDLAESDGMDQGTSSASATNKRVGKPLRQYPDDVYTYEMSDLVANLAPVKTDVHKGSQGYLLMLAGSSGMAGAARIAAEAALRSGAGMVRLVCERSVYLELFLSLPSLLYSIPDIEYDQRSEGGWTFSEIWDELDLIKKGKADDQSEVSAGPMTIQMPENLSESENRSSASPMDASALYAQEASTQAWLEAFLPFKAKASALLIGPGLGRGERTEALLRELLTWEQPLVIDADALFELAQSESLRQALRDRAGVTVLTPHGGEAERLAEAYGIDWQLPRLGQAAALAHAAGCWVVLKGEATLTASPADRIYVNTSGGPGLAKGGSGDILAGLLAGLLAQGLPPEVATPAAVYWHGAAGDLATKEMGWHSVTPLDTMIEISEFMDRTCRAYLESKKTRRKRKKPEYEPNWL